VVTWFCAKVLGRCEKML